jgi:hypothetical protein
VPNGLKLSPKTILSLEDLADMAQDKLKNKIVHLGSCEIRDADGAGENSEREGKDMRGGCISSNRCITLMTRPRGPA